MGRNWNKARWKQIGWMSALLFFILPEDFLLVSHFWNSRANRYDNFREPQSAVPSKSKASVKEHLERKDFPELIKAWKVLGRFPTFVQKALWLNSGVYDVALDYTINFELQKKIEGWFQQYAPDFGAMVVLDAKTGAVLALAGYAQEDDDQNPSFGDLLPLKASFPSASVFKIITAAAFLQDPKNTPDSKVPFEGRRHTLFKKQVLFQKAHPKWVTQMTVRQAFALSVNPVFGKLGVFGVGPEVMRTMAFQFGFNAPFESDLDIEESKALISDDPWQLAETSSGYTQTNQMSVVHGAAIAAATAQDGVMPRPYLISKVETPQGQELYKAKTEVMRFSMDAPTSAKVRELFRETVKSGTARSEFRPLLKELNKLQLDMDLGGKTGTLTALEPRGKADWFAGYAQLQGKSIALCALMLHHYQHPKAKASTLVSKAIAQVFQIPLPEKRIHKRKRSIKKAKPHLPILHLNEQEGRKEDDDLNESSQEAPLAE